MGKMEEWQVCGVCLKTKTQLQKNEERKLENCQNVDLLYEVSDQTCTNPLKALEHVYKAFRIFCVVGTYK